MFNKAAFHEAVEPILFLLKNLLLLRKIEKKFLQPGIFSPKYKEKPDNSNKRFSENSHLWLSPKKMVFVWTKKKSQKNKFFPKNYVKTYAGIDFLVVKLSTRKGNDTCQNHHLLALPFTTYYAFNWKSDNRLVLLNFSKILITTVQKHRYLGVLKNIHTLVIPGWSSEQRECLKLLQQISRITFCVQSAAPNFTQIGSRKKRVSFLVLYPFSASKYLERKWTFDLVDIQFPLLIQTAMFLVRVSGVTLKFF